MPTPLPLPEPRRGLALLMLLPPLAVSACAAPGTDPGPANDGGQDVQVLFDGTSLGDFEPTHFGGEGEVVVEDGRLILDYGNALTGVTWAGEELPRDDYELELVARRIDGTDFFCGLTFPVRDAWLTLVLGGWGGATSGLSCLDGMDASQNETTRYLYFETGKDHTVKVRVAGGRVRCVVAGEELCDVSIDDHDLSLRPEVDLSKPLGIASFATRASIGPITLRRLEPAAAGSDEGARRAGSGD